MCSRFASYSKHLEPNSMNIGIHVKTYRICNPIVEFLKYEFNNKLLNGITLFRVKGRAKGGQEGAIPPPPPPLKHALIPAM